jgi:DNA-binding Xre family transcriptional regulator
LPDRATTPVLRLREEVAMSLAEAIATLAAARGLTTTDVARAIAGSRTRMTLYLVLAGRTTDPRISTVIELCEALRVSPNELLHLAGLLEAPAPSTSLANIALNPMVRELQGLSEDDRWLLIGVLRGIVDDRRAQARAHARCHQGATGEDDTPA